LDSEDIESELERYFMVELWELVDINKNKTGRIHERGKNLLFLRECIIW